MDDLEELLLRHLAWTDADGDYICLCDPTALAVAPAAYARHLAGAIRAWVREREADADD